MSRYVEQYIIGELFLDSANIQRVYDILEPQMFGDEILGRMYLEFQRAYDGHYEATIPVIVSKIQSDQVSEAYITSVIKECVTNSPAYAGKDIRASAQVLANEDKAKRFNDLLNRQVATADTVEQIIPELINQLEALRDNRMVSSKPLPVIVRENKENYFREDEKPRVNLGLPKLDDMLGGLEGGDMIVIGARPAVGKSAFVTQAATHFAELGKKVGFYNLEMQEKQIYERFVSASSGIGLTRIRRAVRFLGNEQERFDRANAELEKRENIIITTGSKSVSEIRAESRHMGYDVIIIDYMQLLRADKTYRGNRVAEVGEISRSIKALATELNIPVIALSQLNRVSEARDTREPTMAELREAGNIEQDASVIILLWNTSEEDKSMKGCKIEKQRQGQTGTIQMVFNGDLMRFEEAGTGGNWTSYDTSETPFD